MDWELFFQQLVSGISIGAIYSLLAVGYALGAQRVQLHQLGL